MRTDKELVGETLNDSTSIVMQGKMNGTMIFISLLPVLSVLAVILSGLIMNTDILDMIKIGIMVFLLTAALMFYVRMNRGIFDVKYSRSIILCMYLISILLVMLQKSPEIYSVWMIGGLLISMVVDSKLGLLVYFNHTFILSITSHLRPDATIHFLIMGVLFSLLSSFLRNKSTVIYAGIILLSTNTTLAFIMNDFIFETDKNINYLASFFSVLGVLVAAFLMSFVYDRIIGKKNPSAEYGESPTDTVNAAQIKSDVIIDHSIELEEFSETNIFVSDKNLRTSYDILLSENNELLQKIKEHSNALYNHSILIGNLSERAAKEIGADEALARAGGYYHEVGKIYGKEYIEEGLKLADDYAFPEELKLILRQHNIKYDKPTFVESAIVMISDNVASTIEYIEKTGESKFTIDKIIENIFKMRMDKGTFDDSGLSVRDFKLLKEFYQNEYKVKNLDSLEQKEDIP